jgi:Uncharacterised nucleotidyltransferase
LPLESGREENSRCLEATRGVLLPEELQSLFGTAGTEWQVLLECAHVNPDTRRLHELSRGKVDWPLFFELAEGHGVLGLAANSLRDCDDAVLPREIWQKIRDWHRAQMLFTLRLTAEMFRLLERFAARGIEILVIKGPVLSVRCYGDPGARQYADLDLIVRDTDILRSTELMTGLGYEPDIAPRAIRAAKAPGEYAFRQPATNLLVEFHTERTFRYYPRRVPLEALFARQARVLIDSHEVPALAVEDELVLICIHGAKHFWERLMWIADVAALVSRQTPDWDRAVSAARQVRAERMLHVGLRLAVNLSGAQLPQRIAAAVQSDGAAARLSSQIARGLPSAASATPGILARAMFRISMRGGFLSGPAYLLRLSLSPTEEDWVKNSEEQQSSIFDALRRPFRLARKYSRDGKA